MIPEPRCRRSISSCDQHPSQSDLDRPLSGKNFWSRFLLGLSTSKPCQWKNLARQHPILVWVIRLQQHSESHVLSLVNRNELDLFFSPGFTLTVMRPAMARWKRCTCSKTNVLRRKFKQILKLGNLCSGKSGLLPGLRAAAVHQLKCDL